MNDVARSAIDSLVAARAHTYEKCSEAKVDSEQDIEAVWEGYLTLVAALYAEPARYEITVPKE